MKIASIVLVLLVLSLTVLSPAPALAQEEDHCDHEAQTIESLRHCVEHAYAEGHITNAGVYQSLVRLIDAAQAALDRGQTSVAIDLLQAFIYTVEAQAGRTIEEPHASHLLEHTNAVLAALSG
jgi:hypothetical protein